VASYEIPIVIFHTDGPEEGRLLITRGPNFWWAEVWEDQWPLTKFDHTGSRSSHELLNLGQRAFFEGLRTIAERVHGVDFDFSAVG